MFHREQTTDRTFGATIDKDGVTNEGADGVTREDRLDDLDYMLNPAAD